MSHYIHADRVIIGTSVYDDGAVLVRDGRIEAAGPADSVPTNADHSRSLPGYTLMPGLIDGHVHLSGPAPETGPVTDIHQNSPSELTIRTVENAHETIRAGITTVRDLGSPNDVVMTVRDAITEGRFDGPRVLTAGQGLTATGGHGDLLPWHIDRYVDIDSGDLGSKGLVVDGETEVRRAVRQQSKLGADLIKVWATDGINDSGGGRTMSFSYSELDAIVDEAERHDLPVAAHAYSSEAIKTCVQAGVRSIEHGHFMDLESIELMADQDVYLTLTLAAFHRLAEADRYDSENPQEALDNQLSMLPLAREHGVDFAMGTDAGTVVANGVNATELGLMVDADFDPLDVIEIATAGTARLLGLEAVGRLEPGYAADLIAVEGDPTVDITILEDPERINLVMKEGVVMEDGFE